MLRKPLIADKKTFQTKNIKPINCEKHTTCLEVEQWQSHSYSPLAAAALRALLIALLAPSLQQIPQGLPRPDMKGGET